MKSFLHEINCFQNLHGRAGCDDGDGRWGELVTARGKPRKANAQSLTLTYKHPTTTCSNTCMKFMFPKKHTQQSNTKSDQHILKDK